MGVKVGKRVKREKKCSCKTGDHYFQEMLSSSYGSRSTSEWHEGQGVGAAVNTIGQKNEARIQRTPVEHC